MTTLIRSLLPQLVCFGMLVSTLPLTVLMADEPPAKSPASNAAAQSQAAAYGPDAPPTAIAPFDGAKAKEHQAAWAHYLRAPAMMTNSIGMKFALIPPGEFDMGTSSTEIQWALEAGRQSNPPVEKFYPDRIITEAPQHRVKISKPFYLGLYEATQDEYQQVMGANPSSFASTGKGADAGKVAGKDTRRHPVEMVSWEDAQQFTVKLSAMPAETQAQRRYRLPTEAEWEYACRAGTATRWTSGNDTAGLLAYAWFKENSGRMTHPVGEKLPNAWALYDMHGNVWEWCSDHHSVDYYKLTPLADPHGPLESPYRVVRGGGFERHALGCRSAYRGIGGAAPWPIRGNLFGFRAVCEIGGR
ncbi:MAG: formylglycine-generating enzyme family protein [Candidatus Sumerlaeota bacterium]|nr:formylglycine-generating enzyme family protein [Candidatus Sumerlaeota bacterium]